MESLPDMYMIIPAAVGVGCVALTVFFIFWIGLGKQRTFEEAKALASRQADLVLQEEYKNSPRAKKGKRQFPRKKKADHWEDPQQEESLADAQARKGILKSAKEATPEKAPRNRVEFNIDVDGEEETVTTRSNPPTPHPHKVAPTFTNKEITRTPQPLFEEPEEETEPFINPPAVVVETAKKSSEPLKPVKTSGGGESPKAVASGKKKAKAKKEGEVVVVSPDDGLSVTRIAEIVSASPLSDDDIQQLVSALLEKMNTNAEWEAANLKTESIKSLKKHNQELQKRCEEAEKTVLSHNSKIKELRSEVQRERVKQQATDTKLQAKISAHSNEMTVVKSRLNGLEEENNTLKARSTAATLETIEKENQQLKGQIAQLTASVQGLSTQAKDVADENAGLKTELARVQEASVGSRGAAREGVRVAELEGLVKDMEHEKKQLQLTMQSLNDDNSRLKAEAASMMSTSGEEVEALKTKVASLETCNSSLTEDKAALWRDTELLRSDKEHLTAEKEALTAEGMVLRAEKSRLEAAGNEVNEQLAAAVASVREEREKEVVELTSEIEKWSTARDEFKALGAQLSAEQTAKKELEDELESLKQASTNGASTNGAPTDQPDSANDEELTRLREEKAEFAESIKQLENKLIDIKDKNNSLRDSLWKAKDESAEGAKIWQTKLKEAHQKSEIQCKAAKKAALAEAWESQKLFLVRMFPTVKVEEADSARWIDAFEGKVQAIIDDTDQQLVSLKAKVVELQENEQKSIQEAESLRLTMQNTMGILERLQSEVEGDNAVHQRTLQEKEEMLDRERTTNRVLQEELRKERETSSSMKGAEERLEEVESRLKEVEHQYELSKQEAESLRHSLTQELEMKDRVQTELEELQETQATVVTRLAALEEEKDKALEQVKQLQTEAEQLRGELQEAKDNPSSPKVVPSSPVKTVDTPQVHN